MASTSALPLAEHSADPAEAAAGEDEKKKYPADEHEQQRQHMAQKAGQVLQHTAQHELFEEEQYAVINAPE